MESLAGQVTWPTRRRLGQVTEWGSARAALPLADGAWLVATAGGFGDARNGVWRPWDLTGAGPSPRVLRPPAAAPEGLLLDGLQALSVADGRILWAHEHGVGLVDVAARHVTWLAEDDIRRLALTDELWLGAGSGEPRPPVRPIGGDYSAEDMRRAWYGPWVARSVGGPAELRASLPAGVGVLGILCPAQVASRHGDWVTWAVRTVSGPGAPDPLGVAYGKGIYLRGTATSIAVNPATGDSSCWTAPFAVSPLPVMGSGRIVSHGSLAPMIVNGDPEQLAYIWLGEWLPGDEDGSRPYPRFLGDRYSSEAAIAVGAGRIALEALVVCRKGEPPKLVDLLAFLLTQDAQERPGTGTDRVWMLDEGGEFGERRDALELLSEPYALVPIGTDGDRLLYERMGELWEATL
jgi:hypothetical protein